MFDFTFLQKIREDEARVIHDWLPKKGKVLEIGGGAGWQARYFESLGYDVHSIDVEGCEYSGHRMFPVRCYDGRTIPYADQTFDVIISSNVLEHISDLEKSFNEMARVLKPEGYAVHVLPSAQWRFWTTVTHYFEIVRVVTINLIKEFPRKPCSGKLKGYLHHVKSTLGWAKGQMIPNRHGEEGNVISETWLFSKRKWISRFEKNSFTVKHAAPMQLFYTGNMFLGALLPLRCRKLISKLLGSACNIYTITPN